MDFFNDFLVGSNVQNVCKTIPYFQISRIFYIISYMNDLPLVDFHYSENFKLDFVWIISFVILMNCIFITLCLAILLF